jgi:hypothetical protein
MRKLRSQQFLNRKGGEVGENGDLWGTAPLTFSSPILSKWAFIPQKLVKDTLNWARNPFLRKS